MGNANTFLTDDDYRQLNSETGCKLILGVTSIEYDIK